MPPIPYGYTKVEGELIEDSGEQYVLGVIRALHEEGWTLNRIAGHLNEQGIRKRGDYWGPGNVHYYVNRDESRFR